jgi:ribosomal protein L37E
MTQRNHFNACPNCNRLMSWQTDKQKCPNCGHEESLEFRRERPDAKDDPILDALRTLQTAVTGISGYWDENVDNAMQQADLAIKQRTRAMMQLGVAKEEGVSVPSLLENAELLVGIAQDELVLANATTKSGLAGLLLIALIGQITCIRSRIRAILSAVQEERKTDGQTS